jgi:hypothetical protein
MAGEIVSHGGSPIIYHCDNLYRADNLMVGILTPTGLVVKFHSVSRDG